MTVSTHPTAVRRRPTVGRSLWGAVEIIIGVWLFVLPLGMLVVGAFRTSPYPTGAWTLSGFANVLRSSTVWSTLGVTFLYSMGVAVLGTATALVFVVLATKSSAPLHRLITPSMVVLIAIPKTFYAIAWGLTGAGTGGLANRIFSSVGLDGVAHGFSLQNWGGVIFVSALKVAAISYLLLLGPARASNPALSDAARVSGASRMRTLFGIEIPMLAPAILGTISLSFVLTMQEFEVPAILGLPANIRVFSTSIYKYLYSPLGPDYPSASVASLLLVAIVALIVVLQLRLLGRRSFVSVVGKGAPIPEIRKHPTRFIATLVIVAWVAIALVIPLVQMLLGSIQPFFGVFSKWTLQHYDEMMANPVAVGALGTTLTIAVVGGLACVLLSFAIAYIVVRRRGPASVFARSASWIPATMPGLVFGLALLGVYTVIPGLKSLYGTPIPMCIGLVVAGVPFAVRAIEGALVQVSPELEEAARVSGDSRTGAILRTTFRILIPSLIAAWILVGFVMSGALDVPLLLSTTTVNTVSTLSFTLYSNGDLSAAAALYCSQLALFTICAGVLALTMRFTKRALRRS